MLVTQRILKRQLFLQLATNSEKRDAMNDKKGGKMEKSEWIFKIRILRELRIEHSVSYAWWHIFNERNV